LDPRLSPLRALALAAAIVLAGSLTLGGALVAGAPSAAARDRGADGKFAERSSSHFRLLQDVAIDRYHGPDGSRQFERDVLAILENAYRQVGEVLGIRPRQRVLVIVYDQDAFDGRFSQLFGFRAAGFYDGAIHIRGRAKIEPRLVGVLHHEYTHAAIAAEAGRGLFPAWLNEGLAEYLGRLALGQRHLTTGQHRVLQQAWKDGSWIPLDSLNGVSFSHLPGETASLAYLESYAVVEYLLRRHGDAKLRRLCEELIRSRSLSRALDRTYRLNLAELQAGLTAELR
jgi:hypothetical protein